MWMKRIFRCVSKLNFFLNRKISSHSVEFLQSIVELVDNNVGKFFVVDEQSLHTISYLFFFFFLVDNRLRDNVK